MRDRISGRGPVGFCPNALNTFGLSGRASVGIPARKLGLLARMEVGTFDERRGRIQNIESCRNVSGPLSLLAFNARASPAHILSLDQEKRCGPHPSAIALASSATAPHSLQRAGRGETLLILQVRRLPGSLPFSAGELGLFLAFPSSLFRLRGIRFCLFPLSRNLFSCTGNDVVGMCFALGVLTCGDFF